jgi:DNA-binding transcriptional LysR family regulator
VTTTPAVPDLRRFHAFVVVAEELHFTRAAERLVMAQSPLSRMIKNLEQDIGAILFIRTRRSVTLTAAGETMLEFARDVLKRTDRAVRRVRLMERERPSL